MSLENILDKNPMITHSQEAAARAKEGVDQIFFDSDHGPGAAMGRYQEVDGEDRITIGTQDSNLTVSAQQFVTDDKFSDFGDAQQRLGLLRKASKYEVAPSQRKECSTLPVAEDLKAYVNSLKPKNMKTNSPIPESPPASSGDSNSLAKVQNDLGEEVARPVARGMVKAFSEAQVKGMMEGAVKLSLELRLQTAMERFLKDPSIKNFGEVLLHWSMPK